MSASDWLASLLWASNQELQSPVDYRSSILTLLLFSLKFSWFLSPLPPPSPRLGKTFALPMAESVLNVKACHLPALYLLFSHILMLCFVLWKNPAFRVLRNSFL